MENLNNKKLQKVYNNQQNVPIVTLKSGASFDKRYNDPKGLMEVCREYNTVAKVVNSKTCTIWAVNDGLGYNYTELLLKTHIVALNAFLNQQNQMTSEQIDFICDQLINDECFKWLTMADLNLVINRIKTSHYGIMYNCFDGCKFFEILREYDTERTQAIEEVRIKEASQYKGQTIKGFDYSKFKINVENEEKERRQANIRRAEEIALEREKIGKLTMKAREIVDAMGIDDKKQWENEFNRVFCELLEGRRK